MNGQKHQSREDIARRAAYVRAFNTTMIKIWKEKIALLGVLDSCKLYSSVMALKPETDDAVTSVTLRQEFLEYGHYAEKGTGSNTPRGNGGDIGRDNPRKRKPWMTRKFLASMYNIREFMADSLGKQACTSLTNALQKIPDSKPS